MAMAFADVQDVEARWRPLTEAEQAIAETLLDDASDMIRSRWPDVDQRVESGQLTLQTMTRITANMVKRAMVNGGDTEGLESRSQTTGPFSDSYTYANPNGNLYLSADDLRILDPESVRGTVKIGWLA